MIPTVALDTNVLVEFLKTRIGYYQMTIPLKPSLRKRFIKYLMRGDTQR